MKFDLYQSIMPDTEEQIEQIIDLLRTTIETEPDILEDGTTVYRNLTLEEMVGEVFCMGINYLEIEQTLDMEDPFCYEVRPAGTEDEDDEGGGEPQILFNPEVYEYFHKNKTVN